MIFPLVILLAITACNDKNGNEVITDAEVKEFISSYDSSWHKRDTNSLKGLMDEQYIYFTSYGGTLSRDHLMGWFTPADKYKVDTASRSEVSYKINGNTAIVSSRWIGNGSFGEEKFDDDQRCSLVLQKKNGKLKIISEHCTQIAK